MIKRGYLKKGKTFSTQEVKFPLTINECHENKLKYPAIIWLDSRERERTSLEIT